MTHLGFLSTPNEYWKICMVKDGATPTVTITVPISISSLYELMLFLRTATFSRFITKDAKLKYRAVYYQLEQEVLKVPVPPEAHQ